MGADDGSRPSPSIPAGWLPLSHTEALVATGEIDLVGLCDTNEQRLIDRGRHYGITALHTDYRLLIDEVRPDIVTIATRTPGRIDIIRHACDRAVKGIYAEKPLANSINGCRRALDAVREHGVKLLYGVNRRYHSTYRQAREIVGSGELGEVREVTVDSGRAQLLWTHPHSVDLLLQFAGRNVRPDDAWALLDRASTSVVGDQRINSDPFVEHAVFRFDNGVIGTLSRAAGLNLRVAGAKGILTVHGDGSRIEIDQGSGPYFLERALVPPAITEGATVSAMRELVRQVRGGAACESPVFIEHGLRMLFGCVWSHMNGNVLVPLRNVPPDLMVTGRFGDIHA